jgi:YD repeat-containing protein
MVAIVSGNNTGLSNTSAGVLGQSGLFGNALHGSSKEGAYVNIFNGNLSLQDGDNFLAANGINLALTRTYNSQAALSDASSNGWQDVLLKQVKLVGTLNDAASYVQRTDADGSVSIFKYQSPGVYVSTDGGGGYQTLTFAAGTGASLGQWTWTSDRTDLNGPYEIYDMNQAGYIVKTGDVVGVRLNYTYTKLATTPATYQLNKVTDAAGTGDSLTFAYTGANLTKVTVTPGSSGGTAYAINYTYDAQNRLSTVGIDLTPLIAGDAIVYTTTYTYGPDVNGVASQLIAGVTQSDGTRLGFAYDGNGRVTSYTVYASGADTVGHTTAFSYDGNGLTTTVTDPLQHTVTYGYDGKGQLTSATTPGVGSVGYTYDDNGNVTSATDARGLKTEYLYDGNGNRIKQHDAAGNTITRTYAAGSNLLLSETTYQVASDNWTPSLPQTTRYVYDTFNRLRYQVSAEGRVTEFAYPEAANATVTTQSQYSAMRRYTAVLYAVPADAGAAITLAQLDTWIGSQAAANRTQTNYTYNPRGLVSQASTLNNDGATPISTTTYTYNASGQVLTAIDASGNKTSYTYDGLGRQLTRIVTNSVPKQISSASYSYATGTVAMTETLFNPGTSVAYSSNIYTYDNAGELLSVQQLGVTGTTVNAYDANGQLRVSTSPGGLKTYWLYDAAGRQVAEIDATGLLTERVYNQDNQVIKTIRYANLLDGNALLALQDKDGAGNVADDTLASVRPTATPQDHSSWNFYDKAGRLVDAVDTAGYVTHYAYDGASRLLTATLRSQTVDTAALAATASAALQQMSGVAQTASWDDRTSRKLYDKDGLLVGQVDALGYLTEYRYNAAGLLVETIAYDAAAKTTTDYTLASMRPVLQASFDLHEYRVYDAQNRLVGTVDADGYLTELTYDVAGNITKRTSYANKSSKPDGAKLADVKAGITVSNSFDNRVVSYTYDALGQLLTATNSFTVNGVATDWVTTNTYDASGKLLSTAQKNGSTSSATYDAQGRLLTQTSGAGAQPTTYDYDANGLLTKKTEPNGAVTVYYYDADGRLTYTVDAVGHVQQQTYNSFGQVVSTRSYATLLATSSANLSGGVHTAKPNEPAEPPGLPAAGDADQRTLFYYDNAGRLSYTVAPDGEIDGRTYSAFGQVATTVHYGATVSTATVMNSSIAGLDGAVLAIVNNAGLANQVSSFEYDADGRLTYSIDPAGNRQGKTYDAFGRVDTTTQYDAAGASSVQSYSYNKRGQVADYTDALGNHIVTTYNGFGQAIIQAQRATPGSSAANATLDSVTRTIYDENGRVAATIDPLGVVTFYLYNGDGKVIDKTTYSKPITSFTAIDAQLLNGNSTSVQIVDTVKNVVTALSAQTVAAIQQFTYDTRGRLTATYTAKSGSGSTQLWSVTTLAYDENDQVIARTSYANTVTGASPRTLTPPPKPAASTSDVRVRMIYDAAGRLTDTLTALNTVDATGKTLAAPAAGATTTWSLVSQQYDAFGNVTQRTAYANRLSVATATAAALDTDGPANAAIAALRTASAKENAVSVYRYDRANRMVMSATAQSLFGAQVRWAVIDYAYNPAGQLQSTTEYGHSLVLNAGDSPLAAPAASTVDRKTVYAYDLANRLTSTTDALGGVTTLAYDARGNVVKRTQHSPLAADKDRVTRTVYDLNNRPLYQIDAAGDVTRNTYDALGNLITATAYGNRVDLSKLDATTVDQLIATSASDRTEHYIYDKDGQRRFAVDAGGYLSQYTYDGLGRVLTTTTYAKAIAAQFATAADYTETKALAIVTAGTAGAAEVTSVVYDAQGKAVQVTDPEGFVEKYTYDALGNKLTYTNQLSKTWTYTYDAGGRLLTQSDPAVVIYAEGATATSTPPAPIALLTLLKYDAFGNLISRTEASNNLARETKYAYDLRGRQIQTNLPAFAAYDAVTNTIVPVDTTKPSPNNVNVIYDVLGNASVSTDVGGQTSYKVYDKLGRVIYDIDAEGYMTGYQRNGFGEVVALTRYALKLTLGEQASLLDYHYLPNGPNISSSDRVIRTTYDDLGHPASVTEPSVTVYDQQTRSSYQSARTTKSEFDAFGQVYRQSVYGTKTDGSTTPAAVTRYYYDARGNRAAQIVALSDDAANRNGYLTTYAYDAEGNQTNVKEYATAVRSWSDTTYATPAPVAADHETSYLYDGNKRMTQETRVGAVISAANSISDLVINYTYDATGNQTMAAIVGGVSTITYYDALGRTTAMAQVRPSGDNTTVMPVTLFRLDAYGNVLVRTDYAAGSSTALVAATGTTVAALPTVTANAKDRTTVTSYDIAGHATKVVDANGKAAYTAYDVYGRAAKQWRTVTNDQPGASTSETWYQINRYDTLGHLLSVQTPGNIDLANGGALPATRQTYAYNAFGEATSITVTSGDNTVQTDYVYIDYDNAGRAWRTNSGDGVDKVTLFDAQGNATVQIRGTSSNQAQLHALRTGITKAEDALNLADTLRTDTRYDLMGRAVDTRQSVDPTLYVLVSKNGVWEKQPIGASTSAGSLLVVGDAQDKGSTITVQYRANASSPWIDQSPARVWTVGDNVVFNSGGLASGGYEYRVIVQPIGEAAYERQRGAFSVTATTSDAQNQLLGQLYVVLLHRAPDLTGLNFYTQFLNGGSSLASLATGFLTSPESVAALPADNAALIRAIFSTYGRTGAESADTGYLADLTSWTNRYAGAVAAGGNQKGQVILDLIATLQSRTASTAMQLSVQQRLANQLNATMVYALNRGSDPETARIIFEEAAVNTENAILWAKGSAAAELRRSQIAQAYLILFARAPEPSGMTFWYQQADANGWSIEQLIEGMLIAPEARDASLYPVNASADAYDTQLITKAYQKALGRNPSAAELAEGKQWMSSATSPAVRHGQFVLQFAEKIASYIGTDPALLAQKQVFHNKLAIALSFAKLNLTTGPLLITPEQQGDVSKAIIASVVSSDSTDKAVANALATVATNAALAATVATAMNQALQRTPLETMQLQLTQLYVALLNRTPDSEGLQFTMDWFKQNGGTQQALITIANQFLVSPERLNDPTLGSAASMTTLQFVQQVYKLALGALPTSANALAEMNAFAANPNQLSRGELAVNILKGMLGFSGLAPDEAALKATFNNKVAVGLACAIDLAAFDWADASQPGVARATLAKVTASDTLQALNYAYAQSQTHLKLMASGSLAAATAATAQQQAAIDAAKAATAAGSGLAAAIGQGPAQPTRLQIMQLYVGLLGRSAATFSNKPDLAGFNFQVDQVGPSSWAQIAQGFINSPEGALIYGGLTDAQFIDKVVGTILGSSSLAAPVDVAYWRAQLQAPTSMSRGQLALNILTYLRDYANYTPDTASLGYLTAKPQFFQRVADAMAVVDTQQQQAANAAAQAVIPVTNADAPLPGLLDTQNQTAATQAAAAQAATSALNGANSYGDGSAGQRLQLTMMYVTLLGRTDRPTQAELAYYISGPGKGTLPAIAHVMINSVEAGSTFPADNAGFITKLYQRILNRTPNADEIAFWSVPLNNNVGAPYARGKVAIDILSALNVYQDGTSSQLAQKLAFDQKITGFMQLEAADAQALATSTGSTYNSLHSITVAAANTLAQANSNRDSLKTTADQAVANAVDADSILAQPSLQRSITGIYLGLRGDVDYPGLAFQIRHFADGSVTRLALIDVLLSANNYPADNDGFVKALYSHVLNRVPTAEEVAFWVAPLAQGSLTRAGVADGFLTSSEAVTLWATKLNNQVASDISKSQSLVSARTTAVNNYNAAVTTANTANTNYNKALTNEAPASAAYTAASNVQLASDAINLAFAKVLPADQAYINAAKAREAYTAAKAVSDQVHIAYATQIAANAAAQPAAAGDHVAAVLAAAYVKSANASADVARAYAAEQTAPVLQRNVEKIAQLFISLWNRAPTLAEMTVWNEALQGGTSVSAMAASMIQNGDPAAAGTPPASLSNDAFITQMYRFGLGRDFSADPVGLRFWSDKLSGANALSRADLVVLWLDNIGVAGVSDTVLLGQNTLRALNGLIADGAAGGNPNLLNAITQAELNARAEALQYNAASQPTSVEALSVQPLMRLYIGILGRTPDMAGFASWMRSRTLGAPFEDIAQGMLTSIEGQPLYAAGQSNRDFLAQVFRNATGREPVDAEISTVLAQMSGITRGVAAMRLLNGIADGATTTLQQTATRDAFNAKVDVAVARTSADQIANVGTIALATSVLNALKDTKLLDLHTDGVFLGIDTGIGAATKLSSLPDQLTLDRWGNVLVQRDARDPNWTVSYSYNDAGQILNTVRSGAAGASITTSNVYNQAGSVIQTTDGNNNVNNFQYDGNGALLSETHADNTGGAATILYTNDAFGQHTVIKQNVSGAANSPGAVITSYTYDNMGRQLTRESGTVSVYWWNPATLLETSGTATLFDKYSYDELGRRISTTSMVKPVSGTMTDPNLTTTTYTRYDLNSNIVSVTDALGKTTLAGYDALNHKVWEKNALNEFKSWSIDAYGRMTISSDLGNNLTKYEYNAAGQLVRQYGVNDLAQTQASTARPNVIYSYDQYTGQLTSVNDAAMETLTTYTYDVAGNRISEKVWFQLENRALQDNTLRYDAFNRLTDIVSTIPGANYKVHYDYDKNGNRTKQRTEYTDDAGVNNVIDVNYGYDKMNRVNNINGTDNGATIQSHVITYNWMGNRLSDSGSGSGSGSGETYLYDVAGRLSQIKNASGTVIGDRHYDSAGRVIMSSDVGANEVRLNQYDKAGRMLKQRVTANSGTKAMKSIVDYTYDDLGNLKQTIVTASDNTTKQTTVYDYDKGDSYRQTKTTVSNPDPKQSKSSVQQYDYNNNLASLQQFDGNGALISATRYISDMSGHVLEKGRGADLTHSLFANGELIGSSSNSYESFSSVYDAVTSPAATSAPSVYVVQNANETLQSIAKAVWGDERLWYVIDEANGGIDGKLKVGQQLLIPIRVNSILNSYQTFAPYNKSAAIGNTTPELAMPAPQSGGGGCGVVGKLIMVVVAVAVVYLTAGAAAGAIYSAMGGTLAAGATVATTGTLMSGIAMAAGGAVAGALGSIASQAVGITIGAQDGFSWSAVAQAGIAGGVTAGVGQLADFGKLGSALQDTNNWSAVATRAALTNAVSQGISNITGLQRGFSWSGVAGSFAGAAIGSQVTSGLEKNGVFASLGANTAKMAISTISGFSAGVATSLAKGGKIELGQIATDAFGNALGSSIAANMGNRSTPKAETADLDSSAPTEPAANSAQDRIRTDIADKLKAAGKLDVSFDKESGELRTGLDDTVDKYLNSDKELVGSIKKFTTTKFNGRNGQIYLTSDSTQRTDFEPDKNTIFINIGDRGIDKSAEHFALTLAHEIGHYEFQLNSALQPATPQIQRANGTVVGYDDFKRQAYDYSIQFGRRTEAAATINEIKLVSRVSEAFEIDISTGNEGAHYADYVRTYNAGSNDTSVRGQIRLLDQLGTQFGGWEHPNDPSAASGGSSHTYQKTWENSAANYVKKAWYAQNSGYDYWQKKIDPLQNQLDNRLARVAQKSGNDLATLNAFIAQDRQDIAILLTNRGPGRR